MRLSVLVASAALLAASVVARGDTFNLSITFSNGSASGIVDIDTATGAVTDPDITVTDAGYDETFTDVVFAYSYENFSLVQLSDTTDTDNAYLYLYFPASTLAGYTGGPLCTVSSPCSTYATTVNPDIDGSGYEDSATSAELTDTSVAATPEPGSLALLGTGVLGVAGLLKKRLA